MRLVDQAEFWAGAVHAAKPQPLKVAQEAEFRKAIREHLEAQARRERVAQAGFFIGDIQGSLDPSHLNIIDIFDVSNVVSLFRRVRRRECWHDVDQRCTCSSVRDDTFRFFGFGLRHANTSGGLDLTATEFERRFENLWDAAVAYLATQTSFDVSAPPPLHGLPAKGPAELLIAPLASAPGAPPVLLRLQQTEGYQAAA
jgi:hypothetical protein